MKKIKTILLILIVLFAVLMMFISCNKYVYNGQKIGILEVKNNTETTNQELWVNGAVQGTITPGKTIKVKLTPGTYTWEVKGLNGQGCKPVTGTIVAGYTQSFNCSVK